MKAVTLVFTVLLRPIGPGESLEEIRGRIAAHQYHRALAAIDGALETSRDPRLVELRARCLFELQRYPECEGALRSLLARDSGQPGDHLARLATVLSLQEIHDDAIARVEEALALSAAPAVRRTAATVYLRAHRYADALPHLSAYLERVPQDDAAHLSRGIALARTGRLDAALPELRRGLKNPESRRDARFELALALAKRGQPRRALEHLVEILEEDPLDAEACYQASRQLLRLGGRDAVRTAGEVTRYFESLRAGEGASSREHHLAAAGQPAAAALERAVRRERLGDYEGVLREIHRARALEPDSPDVAAHLAGFWIRQGLCREAEAELDRVAAAARDRPESDAGVRVKRLAALRARLESFRRSLDRVASDALREARGSLAESPWPAAAAPLEAVLAAAAGAGEEPMAGRAARLLLARAPQSVAALQHLVRRTEVPGLLIPHLHHVSRLAAAEPDNPAWKRRLEECRRLLTGGTSP